ERRLRARRALVVVLDRVVVLDLPAAGAVLGGGRAAARAGEPLGPALAGPGGGRAAVGAGDPRDAAVGGRVGGGGVGADGPGLQGRGAAQLVAVGLVLADRPRALGRARDLRDHVVGPGAGLEGLRLGLGVAAGGGRGRVERGQLDALGGLLQLGLGQVGGADAVPGRPVLLV